MSLNCTHAAWVGDTFAFKTWRRKLAEAAVLPPLDLMEGFYTSLAPYNYGSPPTLSSIADKETAERLSILEPGLPIQWECLKPDVLHELLYISDYRGSIPAERCAALADRLDALAPKMPETDDTRRSRNWREKTRAFAAGLRRAAAAGEPLTFS
jgi:hypothetical protein